jgi:hypothetical protein
VPITERSTLPDICFAVCTALERAGANAVLTGGSAATMYVPHRYQSRDADFIITMMNDRAAAAHALIELGFVERGGVYRHPETRYTLEFPPAPLSIGSTVIHDFVTITRGDELLHLLSRSDSICDRLAAFFHWSDRSALRTALDIAVSGEIDVGKIERWAAGEGATEKYAEFAARLAEERSGDKEAPH